MKLFRIKVWENAYNGLIDNISPNVIIPIWMKFHRRDRVFKELYDKVENEANTMQAYSTRLVNERESELTESSRRAF